MDRKTATTLLAACFWLATSGAFAQSDPTVPSQPEATPKLDASLNKEDAPAQPAATTPPMSQQIQGRIEQTGEVPPAVPNYSLNPPPAPPPMPVAPYGQPQMYQAIPGYAPVYPPPAPNYPPFNLGIQQNVQGMRSVPPLTPMSPGLQQLAPLLQQLPAQLQQMGLPDLQALQAQYGTQPDALKGNVETNVKRPTWIPGYAYSNDAMATEYHNMDIIWSDKRLIPPKPQWMRLSPSVIKYWRGNKEYPYWVHTIPLQAQPGNFAFSSNYPGGPKGWLQYTGEKGRWGFPLYRYWFDPS